MNSYTFIPYGAFDAPHKAVWSPFHQQILVVGGHTAYLWDPSTQVSSVIQASDDHSFMDGDVSDLGEILLVLSPDVAGGYSSARLISPDLSTMIATLRTTAAQLAFGQITGAGQFVTAGYDQSTIVEPAQAEPSSSASNDSSSSSANQATSVLRLFSVGRSVNTDSLQVTGEPISLTHQSTWAYCLAVTSGGDVVQCPLVLADAYDPISNVIITGQGRRAAVVKNIGSGVSVATSGGQVVGASAVPQSKIRIYVGSQPWQSDRWDSGVVETTQTSILYGGGDNLQPGQPYWVHIATFHQDSGWSAVSIQRFVTPRQ